MTEPSGLSWSVISSMEIVVAGQNITTHCDIKRSVFEMHAGPLPGTAKVYVRDLGHELSIETGAEITLDIEDLRVWGGYVMSITREYAFPVDDTSVPAETPRYFVLDCSDYNILFSKRFIRNKKVGDEAKRVPKYPAGKHDDDIVHDLVNNYLDLEDDHLTYAKVQYVGTPQEDNPGSPAVPAMTWATAMKNTALLPGAIYFIGADKDLAYADVDVEDAPFDLSDEPDGSTSYGYREMSIVEDGTMLATAAFVWGTGLGQDKMTFKRYGEAGGDAWQWSDYRQDLYRPESVLKRAKTYIDGSTQNNRGHKNPAITIRCTIIKPGLRAGMKVHFVCGLHGYDDIIPIRSMRIRFVNNTEAMYDLVLAHFLDEAWNTAEFPPLLEERARDTRHCEHVNTDCGIDTFTRTVDPVTGTYDDGADAWMVSDSGLKWELSLAYSGSTAGVDGSRGYVISEANSGDVNVELPVSLGNDFEIAFLFEVDPQTTQFDPYSARSYAWNITIEIGNKVMVDFYGDKIINWYEEYGNDMKSWIELGSSKLDITQSRMSGPFWFKVGVVGGTTSYGKVWLDGDPEPVDWQVSKVLTAIPVPNFDGLRVTFAGNARDLLGDNIEFTYWLDTVISGDCVAYVSQAYAPGSLTATTLDGGAVTITEVDPILGAFTYEPPGDIMACYLEEGTDEPPGGYDGWPVYRPRHVRQLGWGTILDGSNCTMASACIALDRQTKGDETSTPPHMRALQDDQVGGTDLNDAAVAWMRGWSEYLDVHYGASWSTFVSMVNSGRGGILQGTYSRITKPYSSQLSFDGGHSMYVNEFRADGWALVYDPLATGAQWMPAAMLRDYAETFGHGSCSSAFTKISI